MCIRDRLQLTAPVAGKAPAALGMPNIPIQVGGRFTVAGVGVTVRGDGKSGGSIRVAGLIASGKPGTLQIRLVDPVGQGVRDGLGACTGDSGCLLYTSDAADERSSVDLGGRR